MDVETISLALRSLPLWPHAISEEDLVLLHLFFLFFCAFAEAKWY